MPYTVVTLLMYDCIFGYIAIILPLRECRKETAGTSGYIGDIARRVFRACGTIRMSYKRKRDQLQLYRQHGY